MKSALKTLLTITLSLFCLLTSVLASGQESESAAQVPDSTEFLADVPPGGLVTIYSNLNTVSPAYDFTRGYFVAGPLSAPKQHWLAMPFTPTADSHVTQIQVAMQWFGAGPNDVTIKLATGPTVPTTLVPGSVKTLSALPTFTKLNCCPLPTVTYANPGIAVSKTKQYWVVAVTNSASTDTEDIWCLVWNDAIGTFAYNHGQGWIRKADQDPALAFAVLGTTP